MLNSASRMDFDRQRNIVNPISVGMTRVTVIGCGSIGSFACLAMAKMGISQIEVYDNDRVSEVNLPNQFFREADLNRYKVNGIEDIVRAFAGVGVTGRAELYDRQQLRPMVVVATDSMASRRMVWEQFKRQIEAKDYIEARMGGEIGIVYSISKNQNGMITDEDVKFYETTLYSDAEAEQMPCGERSIIYNVLMISSLICRAVKAKIAGEAFNKETIFSMRNMFYQGQ